jgi:hypothetical protein
MKNTMLAVLLLASAAGPAGAGDSPPAMKAGEKVRLTPADPGSRRLTGTVLEVQPDALVIKFKRNGQFERVPFSALGRLEVARGRRGHSQAGALVGLVPGFAFGYLLGSVVGCIDQGSNCNGFGAGLVGGAYVGGVTALAGGLIGLAIRTDRWNEVPLPSGRSARLGAAVVPLRRGVAAGLTLSF